MENTTSFSCSVGSPYILFINQDIIIETIKRHCNKEMLYALIGYQSFYHKRLCISGDLLI